MDNNAHEKKQTFIILDNTIVLFKEDKQLSIPIQIMGLRITKLGLSYKIHMELIGLTILWDAERMVNIEATAGLFNRTSGLCGTLDQNPSNDFMSKDGSVHKVSFFHKQDSSSTKAKTNKNSFYFVGRVTDYIDIRRSVAITRRSMR